MNKTFTLIVFGLLFAVNILPQQITVVAPNGGESLPAGAPYGVRWTDDISEKVRIDLYKNGAFYYNIIDSTESDAYYTWYVMDTTAGGNDYKIKITSVANSGITDYSDGNFTIVPDQITVNSPNGGENWQSGLGHAVTWTDNIDEDVKIDLYKGGTFYYTITPSSASNGYYLWTIADTTQPGNDYQLKISSVDFSSISDISDAPFSIYNQELSITSPNGGETLPAAAAFAITWTDNISSQVRIDLYKNDSFYYTIVDSTPSDAYYSWYVADTTAGGDDYKIKITNVDNSNTTDFSDGYFTITGNQIIVTDPNGGEELLIGAPHAIKWTDNINEGVTIQLFKGGSFYYTIVDTTESDAYYAWSVPDTITPGNDYSIKIMSVDFSSINDMSDGYFTITNTTDIAFINNGVPKVYSLSQNFPNPFNPSTYIMFGLPYNSNVTLILYDINGQEVEKIIDNEALTAGMVRYRFNASKLASGVYIYRIIASSSDSNERFIQTKKMMLLK